MEVTVTISVINDISTEVAFSITQYKIRSEMSQQTIDAQFHAL